METTASVQARQAKARQADSPANHTQQHVHIAQPIDTHKWAKIIGLVLLGIVLSRLFAASPAPTMAPVAAPAPTVVQQAAPIIVQQPQVTILKPQETIVIQKSYPNRTIVIESSPTVLVQ